MSILSQLFGSNTSSSTVSQALTPQAQQLANDLFSASYNIARQPYTPYNAARIAGFVPDETRGFELARDVGNQSANIFHGLWDQMARDAYTGNRNRIADLGIQGEDLAKQGVQAATGLARTFDTVNLDGYMNPYVEAVLAPALADLERVSAQQRRAVDDRAIQTGSFGGSRNALAQSEVDRNRLFETGRLSANERARAYNEAANQYRLDQTNIPKLFDEAMDRLLAGQQSLANVENARQQHYNQLAQLFGINSARLGSEVSPLLEIGGAQRDLSQRNLDLAYGDFLTERDWAMRGADELRRTLGIPVGTTSGTTTVQQGPQPNRIGQALGAGIGLAGLVGQGAGALNSIWKGTSNFLSGIFGGGKTAVHPMDGVF
jgi:hypothetical protein